MENGWEAALPRRAGSPRKKVEQSRASSQPISCPSVGGGPRRRALRRP